MPPVLDPQKSKVDGLAFLGLSLARKGPRGHPDSVTHQQAFDFDQVQDRDYEYVFSTNDDGWLVGGGEPGPPLSYKLPAKDSAHVELMRIGTYQPAWGGLTQDDVVQALQSGHILIPEITVVPTAVVANPDTPPELEIRFDMPFAPQFDQPLAPLPPNWQLRFIQNQLFDYFQFPSRFNPGSFHSTILRKAEFRSPDARDAYFAKCQSVVDQWMHRGQQPLAPPSHEVESSHIAVVKCRAPVAEDGSTKDESSNYLADYYRSGLWLFTDRNTITHQFLPNFYPPYDTAAKRKLILSVLAKEWDEATLRWKPVSDGSLATTTSAHHNVSSLVAEYFCGVSELSEGVKRAMSPSSPDDDTGEMDRFFQEETKTA